ncbi:uncharacterized protein LTR77_007989 [Saxophila tyrrhenica]|uniref:Rhodopsin domain-containing protein n=1 Tax=Saxophila tyrrhenica TaxID=1690608 RepID=A0AAV9P582_9PEZI|nr:hypothetical protein LTR77_007989 [Saxophila tyrrhenica]
MAPTPENDAQLAGAALGLSENGLIAVAWAGFTLAACFVGLRCYARITDTHRLYADDYCMLAALFFLGTNAVLQTLQAESLYYVVYASVGLRPMEGLLDEGNIYVRYQFAIIALFWTIVWSVKASFLVLYWRLFDGLKADRRILLGVAAFTVAAYIGCWFASVWTCHPPSTYFDFGQCTKPIDVEGSVISISYSTAIDIFTDFLIMALPIRMIRNLQVNAKQKAGLAGIFSVGLIIIAVALVRLSQIVTHARADPVGLAVWGLVESSIAVVVGSLPPLKAFMTRTLARTMNRSKGASGGNSRVKYNNFDPQEEQSLSKSQARVGAIPLEDRSLNGSQDYHTKSVEGQIVRERDYY